MKTTNIVGKGILTIDHTGLTYKGTKDGEDICLHTSYQSLYTLIFTTSTKYFGTYIDGTFYEFYPINKISGKALLLVEEMHRYHVNTWANYPDKDYLYQGCSLGIDNK